ncbi:MAG: 30S ribosomal protein S19e [Nanobdellota archaeon]
MKNIFKHSKQDLSALTAEALKEVKEMTPPQWADFVKTGTNKDRPPIQDDWWYRRAASILLKVQQFGPVGVSKLRVKYGSKKRRGYKPSEFRKSSGNILRKILQQLETAGLVKQDEKGSHKGRVITGQGVSLLNKAASNNSKGK